jgi:hypothetical protein
LFILSFIGLFYVFRKNKDYFVFFLLTLIPAFVYLGAQIPMVKHFIWILVLGAPMAGIAGEKISGKIKLKYIIILFLVFNLFWLGMSKTTSMNQSHFYSKSTLGQLMTYKERNIPDNALIVTDSRIYRAYSHWAFNGKNYVEVTNFFELAQQINSQGNLQNIDVYYIECVTDDCGWGTIYAQPELNETMENLTRVFANQSVYSKNISGFSEREYYIPGLGKEKVTEYRIYKLTLPLNPAILSAVKQTHVWWLAPIGWDRQVSPVFDDYSSSGLGGLLNKFAFSVLYFELMTGFFAIIYVIYIFIEQE